MNPQAPTQSTNPVTGPKHPPGFTGLRRWTDIRAAVPLLLIVAVVWTSTRPLALTQTSDARSAPDRGATVVDASDIVARTPEQRETPMSKPSPTAAPRPTTVAQADVTDAGMQPQPPPPVAPEPAVPPTPSVLAIARQKHADDERAALDAPLVATPVGLQPRPSDSPADDAHSGYWLRRGMSIPATLYTSIDSTVPGVIVAYVADDVYDFTHAALVIPRGAKLIGSFGGRGIGIAQGQARIPASFDAIQLADRVVPLGDEPGIDRAGTSGLGARVDRHTRDTVESFAILTGIGLAAHSSTCTNCEQSGSSNVGSTIVSAGTPFLPQPNAIQPTLHVAEGAQLSVMLTHDMRVPAWAP